MRKLFRNQIKMIRSLQNKKGRNETGFFVIEGIKAVSELLISGIGLEFIVLDSNFDQRKFPGTENISTEKIFECDISSVSVMSSSEGILAVAKIPEKPDPKIFFSSKSELLALFDISDPGNLGTIIRTAVWFGLNGIVLIGNCADPFSPKVVRSSMGAVFHIEIVKSGQYSQFSQYLDGWIKIGTFLDQQNNYSRKDQKQILFLGNEASGLDDDLKRETDMNYRIEAVGTFDSLNVSVAGGIIIHEIFNNRSRKCL